uniref:Uncharacterized protein n=2 Tax=Aegilops tauschii subsp. strangulata TaxID=200361 RepID=A0A453EBX2_AEGTS
QLHQPPPAQPHRGVDTINLNGPSAEVKVILKPIISYQAHSRYIVQAPWGDFFQIWRHDKYNKENGRKDRVADKFFVYKIDFVEQRSSKQITSKITQCSLVTTVHSCFQ